MSRLHHVAVGSLDVERLARFYVELFSLVEAKRHHDEHGVLRSIWLDLDGTWLMLERSAEPPRLVDGIGGGPFLLALRVSAAERRRLESALAQRGYAIESRTPFTSYTRDPDGNRVAFSHYPDPAEISHES